MAGGVCALIIALLCVLWVIVLWARRHPRLVRNRHPRH